MVQPHRWDCGGSYATRRRRCGVISRPLFRGCTDTIAAQDASWIWTNWRVLHRLMRLGNRDRYGIVFRGFRTASPLESLPLTAGGHIARRTSELSCFWSFSEKFETLRTLILGFSTARLAARIGRRPGSRDRICSRRRESNKAVVDCWE